MTQRQLRDGNHNKIHLRCNHGFVSTEVDAEMSIGRKEFEDFLAKYLVEECGFAEPVRTTEIYTDSEHQAQVKLLQGQTRVECVDGEGKKSSGKLLIPIQIAPGLFVVAIGIVFLRFWLVNNAKND